MSEPTAAPGLEYQRLKAKLRAALFGVSSEPPRIGRFTVLRRIGEGGMGVVYAAYDEALERKVAIKLVRPELGDDDAQLRIRHEAQAAARLSHPNVVSVYEIGEHQGRLFVAMEFIRGRTLRQWLRAAPRPWQSVVDVFIEAGHGLHAAHAAGLVHRDFKPDNVMIDDAPTGRGHGRVRVLDFGVAIELGATTSRDAGLVGTPAYMAPEQLRGELADARSDQFAFCLSLSRILFPDDGSSAGARVPARLRRLLERGLAPRREDRHASMDAVVLGLVRVRQRPRRWGFALSVTAVAGVAIASWASRARSECSLAAARIDTVWDRGARARLDPGGAADPAVLVAAIDDYAASWRDAHARVCDDSPPLADQDRVLQQRRCLAASLDDLEAWLATDVPPDTAIATVRGWTPPASCLDPEHLRRWAEQRAQQAIPPPPGSSSGLVSDFEVDLHSEFGFGWVRSTDEFVDGSSTVALAHRVGGAHGSAGALAFTGDVRGEQKPRWAGAMFFPGAQAMGPANLAAQPMLSFAVRGSPGRYDIVLFTQSTPWGESAIGFEVGDTWRDVEVDLRELGVPLYDVTGIFIGRSVPGPFECSVDDVRLDSES